MGDLPPPPMAAAESSTELPFSRSERSAALASVPHKTITSSHSTPVEHVQPRLGRGSAMFSTDLGRKALRKLQGPPYAPVIVHSNMVPDVVNAASLWRSKYPFQYLCIFPHAGWEIGDLWDEEDIHLETESFCKQVLQFIERDNGVRAQKFAQDWSDMYPERLSIVGGDMTELYDKSNPLSIVDEIFVNEESRQYPPIFLWHVAHIMRTAMLAVKGVKLPVKDLVTVSGSLGNDNKVPVVDNALALATAGPTAMAPTAPVVMTKTSTLKLDPAASMPSPQPMPTRHKSRKATPSQGYAFDPTTGGNYAWTPGYGAQMAYEQYAGSPGPVQTALRIPRTRAGRSASGTYNQHPPYVENMPHVPSGLGPHQHASGMPMVQSPRYNQVHTVMSQSMGNAHPSMVPVTNEQIPMPPDMIAGPPQPHSVMYTHMMPPHATRVSSATHGYPRQPSGSQVVPFAAPMGDITNLSYPPGMSPQNFGSSLPADGRFNQRYTAGNVLYDPYDGSNPAFMGAGYSNGNSRKTYLNGHHNSNGRPRKTSFPGSRQYQGQYMNDRSSLPQTGGKRNASQKTHLENDPAITQDRDYGCYESWIGPYNETVNELYVKDLPEDVEPSELEAMFHSRLGVKPTSINIKGLPQLHHRTHAFVAFANTSTAKQGILIRDATIRQIPITITVPRRFFQKATENPPRHTFETGPSSYCRYTGNPNNGNGRSRGPSLDIGHGVTTHTTTFSQSTSYSPQDARSGMQKKKKGRQPQQDLATEGSPKARKTKSKQRQESPTKETVTDYTEVVSTATTQRADKDGDGVSVSDDAAPATAPVSKIQTQHPRADEVTSADPMKIAVSSEVGQRKLLDTIPLDMEVQDVVNALSSTSSDHQHHATTEPLDLHNEQKDVPGTDEKSGQGPSLENLAEHVSAEQGPAPTVSLDPEDKVSEEELTNLTPRAAPGFLEVETEPGIGSDLPNQGTVSMLSEAVATTYESASTPIASSAKSEVVNTTVPPVVPTAEVVETPTQETEADTMAPRDLQAAGTSLAAQQDASLVTTTGSPVSEPIKKSGAQHTESLHPFSKATKAQAKREKEQKKKALKKEKEQAEKAKTAKAAAGKAAAQPSSEKGGSNKVNNDSKTTILGEAAIERTDMPAVKDSSISSGEAVAARTSNQKPTSAGVPSDTTADGRNKPGKKKVKKTAMRDTVIAEKEGEEHGKQIGGTVNIPNESSSVTNKEMKANLPEDAPASDAQSSEPILADETSSAAKEHARTVSFAEDPSIAAKKKKNKGKKKKKTPTWPDLEFRPKSPNPSWMGPIDMVTDVKHYDEMMNRACGGEDDSDFSWSDIPLVEDEMSVDEEELEEGDDHDEDDKKDLEAIQQRIAELSGQQAATPSGPAQRTATIPLEPKTGQTSIVAEGANEHPAIAVLETQIVATKKEINASITNIAASEAQRAKGADAQPTSGARVEEAQASKKKKRKNKKKKKAPDDAETTEAQVGSEIEAAEPKTSTSNITVQDLIDSNDPFYDQLKEIDDAKRGSQGAPTLRGGHDETAKVFDEPQLMRTMEAYFKETQGSGQPRGRKVSKHDLYD